MSFISIVGYLRGLGFVRRPERRWFPVPDVSRLYNIAPKRLIRGRACCTASGAVLTAVSQQDNGIDLRVPNRARSMTVRTT